MKKQLLLLMVMLLTIGGVFFTSCSKEEEEKSEYVEDVKEDVKSEPEEEVRYYIKYEAEWSSVTRNSGKITYMTDKGQQTTEVNGSKVSWDGTYGPVKKGFAANISCDARGVISMRIRIYASRDKEPFVVKAETSTSSASYTIDFYSHGDCPPVSTHARTTRRR